MNERKKGKRLAGYGMLGSATNRTIFNPKGSAAVSHPQKAGGQGFGTVVGPTLL